MNDTKRKIMDNFLASYNDAVAAAEANYARAVRAEVALELAKQRNNTLKAALAEIADLGLGPDDSIVIATSLAREALKATV